VLGAMGYHEARIRGSVRFSLGRFTTAEEIDIATTQVVESVRALRIQ
ncbi:MAG TPA: IscS subfamily cysteine desulfurase, partial [Acidobacteria bacterium]|nr:IscS subfamily cysteine desulfurase [Acidobacteriota bacterium]